MKKLSIGLSVLIVVILSATLLSFQVIKVDQVKGWYLAGSEPDAYNIGVEKNAERGGNVAFMKSIKKPKNGKFGTIMQSFAPDEYLGKRVKLSGYVKSEGISDWAGVWFRVDGEQGKVLNFDNMQDRPIKGTTGWKKYEIVLEVPSESVGIAYGVLLSGAGQVWIDDLKFEVVDKSVPETKKKMSGPQNTNFEESN